MYHWYPHCVSCSFPTKGSCKPLQMLVYSDEWRGPEKKCFLRGKKKYKSTYSNYEQAGKICTRLNVVFTQKWYPILTLMTTWRNYLKARMQNECLARHLWGKKGLWRRWLQVQGRWFTDKKKLVRCPWGRWEADCEWRPYWEERRKKP